MVLDPNLVNCGIVSGFAAELLLVLPVGICGEAPGCHIEQLRVRGSEARQECLHLPYLPRPAMPAQPQGGHERGGIGPHMTSKAYPQGTLYINSECDQHF